MEMANTVEIVYPEQAITWRRGKFSESKCNLQLVDYQARKCVDHVHFIYQTNHGQNCEVFCYFYMQLF